MIRGQESGDHRQNAHQPAAVIMIDLSFLTDEEQETILVVLKRDAELKKVEEQRIQKLQKTVSDRGMLRILTGEWFYETKQLRHQDRIHGSDIIRTSMRHAQKLLTKLEFTHILPVGPSYVSRENHEMFGPTDLCGLPQGPKTCSDKNKIYDSDKSLQETPKSVLRSPIKRENPFNSELVFEENNSSLNDRKLDQRHEQHDDLPEQCHSEQLIPGGLNSTSVVTEAGKPVQLEREHEEDCNYNFKPRHNSDSPVATSYTKPSARGSSKKSSQVPSPTHGQRPHGFLRREETKTTQVQFSEILQKKELGILKPKDNRLKNYTCALDEMVDIPTKVQQDTKSIHIAEVQSLQFTELQKTQLKEKTISLDADTHQDSPGSKASHFSKQLSNLTACLETEKMGLDTISAGEDAKHDDISKTYTKAFDGPQTNSVVPNIHINVSAQLEIEEGNTERRTNCNMPVSLTKDDGTYRAKPVLIEEEKDDPSPDSVTELQLSDSQENITSSLREQHILVNLPTKSSSTSQADRLEIRELTEEYTAPKDQAVFFQSGVRMSSENSEEHHEKEPKYKSHALESLDLSEKDFVGLDRSQQRSIGSSADVQSPCHVKTDTESQDHPVSPSQSQSTRSEDINDKVRKSPSKTYHPKVLPRESSSPKGSRLKGSPLKTFPIDISPQTEVTEEQQWKMTQASGQKTMSHLSNITLTDADPIGDITSPLLLDPDDTDTHFSHPDTPKISNPSALTPTESVSGLKLARSIILQDQQDYLGPQEKAHRPHFQPDKDAVAGSDAAQRNKRAESDPPDIKSRHVQKKDRNSGHDVTTRTWSLSLQNSESSGDRSCPSVPALKQLSSRSMSSSKSLEILTSQTTSTLPKPKAMKASCSVPLLQQDEVYGDSSFDISMEQRLNSRSLSNMTLSSGMASMSSVSSISSIYPADCGDIKVQGSIQFAVNYIQKLVEFQIFVVLCRGLAAADTKNNRSDPYVKCYLLPDKTKLGKRKTSVKKKTLNPIYNEVLTFKIVNEMLKTQNLNISVWHNNTFGRNSFLGEVDLRLSEWDFSNTQINEYALKARVSAQISSLTLPHLMDSRGQMRVALRFLKQTSQSKGAARTETGEVQIWVKDCKNLPPVRGVTINPFVKCTVLPDTSWKSRQKTRVVKRTESPMFNHTMVYDGFRLEDLREACVELTVWDHDRLKNHFVGGLRLGLGTGKSYGVQVVWMDSTTREVNLWQRMLRFGGEWVEDVLPLRLLETAKSMSL